MRSRTACQCQPTVVMLSQMIDPHIEPVVQALQRYALRVVRFDLSDFPTHIQLATQIASDAGWHGTLLSGGETIALMEI